MGTENQGSTCSTIAALASRRRTECTERQAHTQTHYRFKWKQRVHTWTYKHPSHTAVQPYMLTNWVRTALKSHLHYFAKIIYSYLREMRTMDQVTWWSHHHIAHKHRCILGALLTVIALCCDAGLWSTHAHIQIHTEEQKCIYNLFSFCFWALDYLGLLNCNDPLGHHEFLVHTRQQMAAGIPSSC